MPITMKADRFSSLPEPADPDHAQPQRHAPRHDWRIAATIFTAVFVALGGVFAILEYSARRTDKTNENIYYRFNMLDERLGVMNRQFQAADSRFERIDRRFDGIDHRIERLEVKVDQGFARVDERFAKVDERFGKVDERLARVDDRLARVDDRFDKLEAKFDNKFDQLKGMLQTLVEQKASSGTAASGQARGNRPR
ncbi:hypothetical protein [Cupriavidus sp. D384]|uniref:hypothetical protein n=1 Tax=Cupriavidus sp. D384 TaxID=1538095 RepID=UPI000834871E|nr:hypothetical protein [Cupriavidus sp. D384]